MTADRAARNDRPRRARQREHLFKHEVAGERLQSEMESCCGLPALQSVRHDTHRSTCVAHEGTAAPHASCALKKEHREHLLPSEASPVERGRRSHRARAEDVELSCVNGLNARLAGLNAWFVPKKWHSRRWCALASVCVVFVSLKPVGPAARARQPDTSCTRPSMGGATRRACIGNRCASMRALSGNTK